MGAEEYDKVSSPKLPQPFCSAVQPLSSVKQQSYSSPRSRGPLCSCAGYWCSLAVWSIVYFSCSKRSIFKPAELAGRTYHSTSVTEWFKCVGWLFLRMHWLSFYAPVSLAPSECAALVFLQLSLPVMCWLAPYSFVKRYRIRWIVVVRLASFVLHFCARAFCLPCPENSSQLSHPCYKEESKLLPAKEINDSAPSTVAPDCTYVKAGSTDPSQAPDSKWGNGLTLSSWLQLLAPAKLPKQLLMLELALMAADAVLHFGSGALTAVVFFNTGVFNLVLGVLGPMLLPVCLSAYGPQAKSALLGVQELAAEACKLVNKTCMTVPGEVGSFLLTSVSRRFKPPVRGAQTTTEVLPAPESTNAEAPAPNPTSNKSAGLGTLPLDTPHSALSQLQSVGPSQPQEKLELSHSQKLGPSHSQELGPSHSQKLELSHLQKLGPSHSQTPELSHSQKPESSRLPELGLPESWEAAPSEDAGSQDPLYARALERVCSGGVACKECTTRAKAVAAFDAHPSGCVHHPGSEELSGVVDHDHSRHVCRSSCEEGGRAKCSWLDASVPVSLASCAQRMDDCPYSDVPGAPTTSPGEERWAALYLSSGTDPSIDPPGVLSSSSGRGTSTDLLDFPYLSPGRDTSEDPLEFAYLSPSKDISKDLFDLAYLPPSGDTSKGLLDFPHLSPSRDASKDLLEFPYSYPSTHPNIHSSTQPGTHSSMHTLDDACSSGVEEHAEVPHLSVGEMQPAAACSSNTQYLPDYSLERQDQPGPRLLSKQQLEAAFLPAGKDSGQASYYQRSSSLDGVEASFLSTNKARVEASFVHSSKGRLETSYMSTNKELLDRLDSSHQSSQSGYACSQSVYPSSCEQKLKSPYSESQYSESSYLDAAYLQDQDRPSGRAGSSGRADDADGGRAADKQAVGIGGGLVGSLCGGTGGGLGGGMSGMGGGMSGMGGMYSEESSFNALPAELRDLMAQWQNLPTMDAQPLYTSCVKRTTLAVKVGHNLSDTKSQDSYSSDMSEDETFAQVAAELSTNVVSVLQSSLDTDSLYLNTVCVRGCVQLMLHASVPISSLAMASGTSAAMSWKEGLDSKAMMHHLRTLLLDGMGHKSNLGDIVMAADGTGVAFHQAVSKAEAASKTPEVLPEPLPCRLAVRGVHPLCIPCNQACCLEVQLAIQGAGPPASRTARAVLLSQGRILRDEVLKLTVHESGGFCYVWVEVPAIEFGALELWLLGCGPAESGKVYGTALLPVLGRSGAGELQNFFDTYPSRSKGRGHDLGTSRGPGYFSFGKHKTAADMAATEEWHYFGELAHDLALLLTHCNTTQSLVTDCGRHLRLLAGPDVAALLRKLLAWLLCQGLLLATRDCVAACYHSQTLRELLQHAGTDLLGVATDAMSDTAATCTELQECLLKGANGSSSLTKQDRKASRDSPPWFGRRWSFNAFHWRTVALTVEFTVCILRCLQLFAPANLPDAHRAHPSAPGNSSALVTLGWKLVVVGVQGSMLWVMHTTRAGMGSWRQWRCWLMLALEVAYSWLVLMHLFQPTCEMPSSGGMVASWAPRMLHAVLFVVVHVPRFGQLALAAIAAKMLMGLLVARMTCGVPV